MFVFRGRLNSDFGDTEWWLYEAEGMLFALQVTVDKLSYTSPGGVAHFLSTCRTIDPSDFKRLANPSRVEMPPQRAREILEVHAPGNENFAGEEVLSLLQEVAAAA